MTTHPINLDNIYDYTIQLFDKIKKNIMPTDKQTGGGVKSKKTQIYENVGEYMKIHNINNLSSSTFIPYGVLASSMNLTNNKKILKNKYPLFNEYISSFKLNKQITFDTLVPIGTFLSNRDIDSINKMSTKH